MTPEHEIVKSYLERCVPARERRFRDRATANLVLEQFADKDLNQKDVLIEVVHFIKNVDRYFRMVQEGCPNLRGDDWGTGRIVQEDWLVAHGYEAGNFQRSKKVKEIVMNSRN